MWKLRWFQGLPEQFLVYHAGTFRTVFIGIMKMSTITLFTLSCFVLAPALYMTSETPLLAGIAGEKKGSNLHST